MLDRSNARSLDVDSAAMIPPADRHALVADAFSSYHLELYSFLRRATGDDEAAQDLLQDVYVRLTREVDADRLPDQIRAWLYRVASNLAISRHRRRTTVLEWLRRQAPGGFVTGVAESPEAHVLRRERTSALDAALAILAPDARTAMLLSGEGFSGVEIAAAIGRSHAATRTLLSRARVRMRLELEQGEEAG